MIILVLGDAMLYMKRHKDGIIIRNKNQDKIMRTTLLKHINNLCIENMATYEGRITAAKKLLNIKSNIPIYISKKLILYPIISIREYDTVLVNYSEVLSIKKVDMIHTKFIFTNLDEKILKVSYQKIMKQHSRIEKIINYLDNSTKS